jgi:hypothetical protein
MGATYVLSSGDDLTPLPFWIESWTAGNALIWVKLPSIPTGDSRFICITVIRGGRSFEWDCDLPGIYDGLKTTLLEVRRLPGTVLFNGALPLGQ